MSINVVGSEPVGLEFIDTVGSNAHFRVDESRRNRIDQDAARGQFHSQGATELIQGGLGHGVSAGLRFRPLSMD